MNNQEAKFILSAYRPNGADADDAMFGEAIKQARQDPTLAAWFAREQAHDSAVAGKLAQMTPPDGLRAAILAGVRASEAPRPFWRQPIWQLVGAAAAILLVFSSVFGTKRAAANDLVAFALKDTAFAQHDGHGESVKALQAVLGNSATRLQNGLALNFSELRQTGCRTLNLNGQEVFEVCFNRGGQWFHLYALHSPSPVNGTRSGMALTVQQKDKFSCASWTDAATGYRYAVVGEGKADAVQNLL
jgi:hypothetical protein